LPCNFDIQHSQVNNTGKQKKPQEKCYPEEAQKTGLGLNESNFHCFVKMLKRKH
jgi:hypothetical protein